MPEFTLSRSERRICLEILQQNLPLWKIIQRFFPREDRIKLAILYCWVKQANDLLLLPPENVLPTLKDYQAEFRDAWKEKEIKHLITLLFVRLAKAYDFDPDWCELYLESLEEQLKKHSYENGRELQHYIFSSGEMIVHMVARLFDLKSGSFSYLREFVSWWQKIALLQNTGVEWQRWQRVTIPANLLQDYDLSVKNLDQFQHSWQFYSLVKEMVPALQREGKVLRSESRILSVPLRGVVQVLYQLSADELESIFRHPQRTWQDSPTLLPPIKTQFVTMKVWWQLVGHKRWAKVTRVFGHGVPKTTESRS